MSQPEEDDSVALICQDPDSNGFDVAGHEEILLSTNDINHWDLPTLLTYKTLRILSPRKRLIEHSSYFQGLLGGNFSESCSGSVSVQWNLGTFVCVLKFIHDCPVDINSHNFLSVFEAALFFGVDQLLTKCTSWFFDVSSLKGILSPEIQLDDLIQIWNFSRQHEYHYIQERCTGYLARNFMWASSCISLCEIPFSLLVSAVNHRVLTVDSEKHLSDALLQWLYANTGQYSCSNTSPNDFEDVLMQIRVSLLPLWFAAGKRRCFFFSMYADESIETIHSLLSTMGSTSFCQEKIRLTEYTQRMDLSGCPQVTLGSLLPSLLPSASAIEEALLVLKHSNDNLSAVSRDLLPFLSFHAVEEVDISMCSRLQLEAAIECFSKSFPSLRKLKAAHLINFKLETLSMLVKKCPLVSDVDLMVDMNPIIPLKVSVLSQSSAEIPKESSKFIPKNDILDNALLSLSEPLSPNIVKLTLQGRSDVTDSSLQYVSECCVFLSYLNIRGCIFVSDIGISALIRKSPRLQALIVCDTSFGRNSVLALCSDAATDPSIHFLHGGSPVTTFASKLQSLHMGGCKDLRQFQKYEIASIPKTFQEEYTGITDLTSAETITDLWKSGSTLEKNWEVKVGVCEGLHRSSIQINLVYKGADQASLFDLLSKMHQLKSLCLRATNLTDDCLKGCPASSLESLDVSDTMVSCAALVQLICKNPSLRCLRARSCRFLLRQEMKSEGTDNVSLYDPCKELYDELCKRCKLEEIELGWGFTSFSLESIRTAVKPLKTITVGLGGSLGEKGLIILPITCPLLESLILYFQVVPDTVMNLLESLKHLRVLALCCCIGVTAPFNFKFSLPNLRILKLERVTPWMTNDHLVQLTQNCASLIELFLIGCTCLNPDSQQIISQGWPGLISIHLEECGQVTANGVSSLFNCVAVEDLLLRHNGAGIQRNFILDAASRMPMLRKISLDLCDAIENNYEIPNYAGRFNLSNVKIARCKLRRRDFDLQVIEPRKRAVHRDTLVTVWSSRNVTTTLVRERL